MRHAALALAAAIVVCPCPPAALADPARDAGWAGDLAHLRERLEAMHPNPYHAHPRAWFDSLERAYVARLPGMSDAEAVAGLMAFVARVEDGHTTLLPFAPGNGFDRIAPVRLYAFSDGVHVVATSAAYASWLGARVLRVGDVPVDEALERVGRHVGSDNASGRRGMTMLYLMIPRLLAATGVSRDTAAIRFEVERDGKRARFTAAAVPFEIGNFDWTRSFEGLPVADARIARPRLGEPLHLQHPGRAWWWTWIPERKTVYFHFRRVDFEDGDRRFHRFVPELFAAVDSLNAERLVVDLRHNFGGNNFLWQPVIHALIRRDERLGPGRLFTIIGRETFSAAMNGANWLEEHTATLFAGEPTAGRPNHYGDAREVHLPNSGLMAFISTLPWNSRWPGDRRPWIAPQLAVEPTFADHRANRDPVLEACLAFDGLPLVPRLRAAAAQGDTAGIGAAMREWKRRWPDRWGRSDEREVNRLGYELLVDRRLPAAVAVLRANAAAHPRSANAWDSLAEALLEAGDRAGAADACRRALALDPGMASAREMLARIEGAAR